MSGIPQTPELRSALQVAEEAHKRAQADLDMLRERARRERGAAAEARDAEAAERRKQRAAAAAAADADVRRLHERLSAMDQARANVALQPRSAVRDKRIADAVAAAAASRTRDQVLLRALKAGKLPSVAEREADDVAEKEVKGREAAVTAAARAAAAQQEPARPNFRAPGSVAPGVSAAHAAQGKGQNKVMGYDGGAPVELFDTQRSRPPTGASEARAMGASRGATPGTAGAPRAGEQPAQSKKQEKDAAIATLEEKLARVTEMLAGAQPQAGAPPYGHLHDVPPYGLPHPPYGYPPHPHIGPYGYPQQPAMPYGYPYPPHMAAQYPPPPPHYPGAPPADPAPPVPYPRQPNEQPPPLQHPHEQQQPHPQRGQRPQRRVEQQERPPTGVSPLPEALAGDDAMRRQHEQHVREMTHLKQQLERERRENEIEKTRAERASLAGSVHGGSVLGVDPTPRTDNASVRSGRGRPEQQGYGSAGRRSDAHQEPDFATPRSAQEHSRRASRENSRKSSPKGTTPQGFPTLAPLDEDDGTSDGSYEPDLFDVAIRVKTLGPISLAGGTRVVASLYRGIVPDEDEDARRMTRAASGEMASVPGMHEYDFDEVIEMNSVEVSDATTLVFEIVWQRQRRAASVGGGAVREETVGWASVPLIDGKSGRALHGSHTLDVHRLPLLLDGALGARLPFDGAKLDFAVDVSPVEDSDDESDDADGEGGDGAALGHDDELPEESAEDVPGVPRAAWMHVGQPSPQNRPFQLGESFVIYVDGLRFAPRNATVVQVTACVMSTSFDRLTPLSRSVARMGSSALHPELGMRVVVQTSEWPDDMPQASLLIQMETIERPSVLHPADRHSSPCVIGYAAINLFVSRESAEDFEAREPPPEGARAYVLNEGAFQLPLHTSLPLRVQGFSAAEVRTFPRVPCATALFRIVSRAADSALGTSLLPRYEDGVYASTGSYPDPVERRVYARRLEWPAPAIREETAALAGAYGLVASGEVDVASDEALAEFAKVVLKTDERANAYNSPRRRQMPMLDYRLASGYVHQLGIIVSVDGVLNVTGGLVDEEKRSRGIFGGLKDFIASAGHATCVVHSLSPPGGLYSEDIAQTSSADMRLLETVNLARKLEQQSTAFNPRFLDGVVYHPGVGVDPSLVYVVDVRRIDHPLTENKRKVVSYGWSFVNVFCDPDTEHEGDEFVASAHYILPLFHGSVPIDVLAKLQRARGPIEMAHVVRTALREKQLHWAESAVVCRLGDAQRAQEFAIPAFNDTLSMPMWVEDDLLRIYKGPRTGAVMSKGDKSKTFTEIAEKHDASLSQLIKDASNATARAVGLIDAPREKTAKKKSAK